MKWPTALLTDICARRAVVFMGAGVSMNARTADGRLAPKSWRDFLKAGAGRLGRSNRRIVQEVNGLIERNDLLTACEVIKSELGREAFVALIRSEFQAPGFRPARIHEAIWRLDLRIAITPNIDAIYDGLVADRGAGTVVVKSYRDTDLAEVIRGGGQVLIKSHGSIDSPNHLIFTRSDYARARNEYRAFYELIYSLLSTHSFLFIGCGLEDPDIRGLLEDYCYRNPFSRKHYFTLAGGSYHDKVLSVLSESLNLEFIQYSDAHDHAELTEGLAELAAAVEVGREDMGRSQRW